MAIFKLSLDDLFDEEPFTLIAIHSTLEHYRVAYFLNKYLGITLKRDDKDILDSKENTNYQLFEYLDISTDITYNLVSNFCRTITEQPYGLNNLFSEENSTEIIKHLIPEQKKAAFFLKIDTVFIENQQQIILNKILSIPQIVTAYCLDANQLKSKNNLIFH